MHVYGMGISQDIGTCDFSKHHIQIVVPRVSPSMARSKSFVDALVYRLSILGAPKVTGMHWVITCSLPQGIRSQYLYYVIVVTYLSSASIHNNPNVASIAHSVSGNDLGGTSGNLE